MNSKKNQPIVIVLGMHRSGTSALTKSLELLGVNLGTELHQPRYDNPKGFWEDKDCVAINDALLSHFSSQWDDLYLDEISDLNTPNVQQLRTKAAELLRSRVSTCGLWGFKDPRSSRLIPFWKLVLKDLNYTPLFVIAVRNPLSVAASLTKRDQLPVERSIYLWQQHNIPALTETIGDRRLVVDYDQLLADPIRQISRIAKALDLQMPSVNSEKVQSYCKDFLEEGLRHATFTEKSLKDNPMVSSDVVNLYELLTKAGSDQITLDEPKIVSAIESLKLNLSKTKPAFRYISALERARAQGEKELTLLNSSLTNAQGELAITIQKYKELLAETQQAHHTLSQANLILKNKSERAEAEINILNQKQSFWTTNFTKYQRAAKLAEDQLADNLRRIHILQSNDNELQRRLTEQSSQLEIHKQQAHQLSLDLENARNQLSQETNEKEGLRLQVATLGTQLLSQEKESSDLLLQLSDSKNELVRSNVSRTELMEEIEKQKAYLSNQIENFKSEKTSFEESIAKSQLENAKLEQTLKRQDEALLSATDSLNNALRANELLIQKENENLIKTKALQAEINQLHQIATEKQITINQMTNSKSWKITKPLRGTIELGRGLKNASLKGSRRTVLSIWQKAPISRTTKDKLRDIAFSTAPFIFKNTNRYSNWKLARNVNYQLQDLSMDPLRDESLFVQHIKDREQLNPATKLIAFYLPQFHPIPENNTWWGEGFTEWTNVKPAEPQFEGHYQPRIPGELGYYNLLDGKTQKRQVELAKNYGIGGFCFYMYWFGGKRLLEQPLDNYLRDQSLDLPFCVCWANENWSRRWDGLDQEILMSQNHSPEDDIAFIAEAAKYLRDARYIRVENKPLLLIYRPALFPDIRATTLRWRHWCQENGIGEIHLAYTQSFESVDPKEYGFDSAIEFPPNNACPPNLTSSMQPLNENFSGTVYDWRHYPARSENYPDVNYTLFRAVCPSWDNTARRKNKGTVFLNSSPAAYQRWLENALNDTARRFDESSKKLVFINAWNEWAEGAYLEPDQKHGYAFLEATRRALINSSTPKIGSILLTTHDCHKHGAQIQTLETARTLAEMGYEVSVIALQGGELLPAFKKIARVIDASQSTTGEIDSFLRETQRMGTTVAITSTVVSGSILPKLKEAGFAIISLIHELPGIIHSLGQLNNAELIAQHADKVVFPAKLVRDKFCELVTINESKIILRPQGLLRKNPFKSQKKELRSELLKQKNLPDNAKVVLTVGYGDTRKGADLIADLADETIKLEPNCYFIWVGKIDPTILSQVKERAQKKGILNHLIFTGFEADPARFYAVADAYALTSREDPFPNVVNEAIDMDIPVVGFEGASGASDFILANKGRLAKFLDLKDFAVILQLILNQNQEALPHKPHSLRQYILDLLFHLTGQPRISVVIPNYNYAHFLEARINSICKQTFPVYEMIILDDKSTDNSIEIIETISQKISLDTTIVKNEINSGSVFKQWHRGAKIAQGDLLWIAEADDLADPEFLSTLVTRFKDPELVLAYTESKQMDHRGNVISPNYLDYTLRASECFKNDYHRHGTQEIIKALAIKNTIPNVSAVVFKTNSLVQVMEQLEKELANMKVAGDWLVYLHLLKNGNVSFSTKALNCHRRHATSVTSALQKQIHLQEIIKMQTLASRVVTLPHTTLDKCTEYIKEIENYFGITAEALDLSVNS